MIHSSGNEDNFIKRIHNSKVYEEHLHDDNHVEDDYIKGSMVPKDPEEYILDSHSKESYHYKRQTQGSPS